MTPEDLLEALKYAGFAITAVASVWALISKTTYEDEHKRKRLTGAGQISIAITLIAATLSMVAFGFETITKQNAAAKSERRIALEKAEQDAKELKLEKKRSADALAQRYLVLTKAAEERTRQLDIARKVAEGTAKNLARTQLALQQLERAVHPLGETYAQILFVVVPGLPGLSPLFTRLREFGEQLQQNPSLVDQTSGVSVRGSSNGIPDSFELTAASSLAPREENDPEAKLLLYYTGANVTVCADERKTKAYNDLLRQENGRNSVGSLGGQCDYAFDVRAEKSTVVYDIRTNTIQIWMRGEVDLRYARSTGRVVSIPDLERSRLFLKADHVSQPGGGGSHPALEQARNGLVLNSVLLKASGQSYFFEHFEALRTGGGFPVYFTKQIGTGRLKS